MLTTAPLPLCNALAKPRARRKGAKKFSSNTSFQPSMGPFNTPSRSLYGVFGEMPALLTKACNGAPPRKRLASATKAWVLAGSARSVGT